ARLDLYGTGHGDSVVSNSDLSVWVHPLAGGLANSFVGALVSYDQSSGGGTFNLVDGTDNAVDGTASLDGRIDTLSNLQGLVGTTGNDTFLVADGTQLSLLGTLDGGGGFDVLTIVNGSGGIDFSNVANIAEVKFDAGQALDIAPLYDSGISIFDFSALAASQNVTFDLSSAAGVPAGVSILGGAGDDTLTGSSSGANYISGGAGHNIITLNGMGDIVHGTAGASDVIYGFSSFDTLDLSVAMAVSGTFILHQVDTAGDIQNAGDYALNGDNVLQFHSGAGADYTADLSDASFSEYQLTLHVTGTSGRDVIDIGSASGTVNGGGGADTITVGSGTATVIWDNPNASTAIDFTDTGHNSTLSLAGTSSGHITLDLSATNELVGGSGQISGFDSVDASGLSGAGVFLHGSNADSTTFLTMIGTTLADTLVAGAGGSVLDGHGGGDTLVGGAGLDNFVLEAPGASQSQALAAIGNTMIVNFDPSVDKLVLPNNLFGLNMQGGNQGIASNELLQGSRDMTSTAQNLGHSGVALILVGDASTNSTHVWYTTDASHASSANSYQVATLVGVDPHSITDMNVVATAAAQPQHGAP
ncbi:MAG TPA: hypothetical protein VK558_05065, partial [Patescibacteria group bacterium]|nr:hypothetical protein [Patescibacteria group bacterium]